MAGCRKEDSSENVEKKPMLAVEKLAFSYGQIAVLEEISFEVTRGGFVTIVGPNGSGKSTLLKNLAGILEPQEGQIMLESDLLSAISPKELARRLGVVPQETAVDFSFTVAEVVLMGRMPHQRRFQGDSEEDLAIAQKAMAATNTWYLADRLVTELSGGERQRVIVARALAQQPQILLLDEPTAHLDIQHQMELLQLLQKINEEDGVTILAVLHDLNLAAQFSKYMVLLDNSRIFAAGRPEEVLTAANISQVYSMEVVISPNELTGRFNIIPVALRGKSELIEDNKASLVLHLICGGGSGSFLMEQLTQQGYKISCGVLNIGDSDWSKARGLDLTIVEEVPFANISPVTYAANLELIEKADVIVVLPIPFGLGNLENLEQALQAAQKDRKVIVVGSGASVKERDFTGGQAAAMYRELLRLGAWQVDNVAGVLPLLISAFSRP